MFLATRPGRKRGARKRRRLGHNALLNELGDLVDGPDNAGEEDAGGAGVVERLAEKRKGGAWTEGGRGMSLSRSTGLWQLSQLVLRPAIAAPRYMGLDEMV